MIISAVMNKKAITTYEYGFAVMISCGLVAFSAADFHAYPDVNPLGTLNEL
jgi:hypothetical protein